jgi:hypothetical protein
MLLLSERDLKKEKLKKEEREGWGDPVLGA